MSKRYPQFIKFFFRSVILTILTISFVFTPSFYNIKSYAFDRNYVIGDDLYTGIPVDLSSPGKIESYLRSQGSLLADYQVLISFESDDTFMDISEWLGVSDRLSPPKIFQGKLNTYISVPNLIYELSRGELGNGCGFSSFQNICIDNSVKPLNPAFLLALIQKESGLVRGTNAQKSTIEVQDLLDRATGYFCFESSDKTKGCFDQNPEWRFYKGFFRQVYFASRLLRIRQVQCDEGVNRWLGGGNFKTGSWVTINSQPIYLGNGITCALYIYTPHISAQELFYKVYQDVRGDIDLSNVIGLPDGYIPDKVETGF